MVCPWMWCPTEGMPLPPQLFDGGPVYAVWCLICSRRRGRGLQYLVNWEGYGPEDRPFVPDLELVCSVFLLPALDFPALPASR